MTSNPSSTDSQVYLRRARAVLGVDKGEGPKRIRYAYYRSMFLHHPDRNPDDAQAHLATALINEAFELVLSRSTRTTLLADKDLVNRVMNTRVEDLPGLLTYEEWLRERFYDVGSGSIWPT